MKAFVIVAIVVVVLGIWEHDELLMLYHIKRGGGKLKWSIDDYDGLGVTVSFDDDSEAYFIVDKGLWRYLCIADDTDEKAYQVVRKINDSFRFGKLLERFM